MTNPVVHTTRPEEASAARIDFAYVVDKQFLVYGWIWEFATSVKGAAIQLGGVTVDLEKLAVRVRRPDVTRHFSAGGGSDQHGFCALVTLPDAITAIDRLTLTVTLHSGETMESRWPVACYAVLDAAAIQPHVKTLEELAKYLPKAEAKRLAAFAGLALRVGTGTELPSPVRFEVDLCCVLENRILVVFGWVFDPARELSLAQLRAGEEAFDLLANSVRIPRPDISPDPSLYRKTDTIRLPGFIFVKALEQLEAEVTEARFTIAAGSDSVEFSRPVNRLPHEARKDFLLILSKMDPDSALMLNERVAATLDETPEQQTLGFLLQLNRQRIVERLPVSIEHSKPRYSLFIDKALPVADAGMFLVGWFNADPGAPVRVVCHCGSSSFDVSSHWIRHPRPDVTTHLARAGVQTANHQHGFLCYVPFGCGDAPYFLSIESAFNETRRIRVVVAEKAESGIQAVRALLTLFDPEHRELRSLLDLHIGPAVQAVWAGRHKPMLEPVFRTYGTPPPEPVVSMIVPLYGRHDFADYQMALFAGDPDFQDIELIYVVDDPAIFDEFRAACPGIYGLYQTPFAMAFPGANLGYAGANNFGVKSARGKYLLFLNSDVMPKRPGWVGELLRNYRSIPALGLLGAKLLYEDGSLQHAGIAFRRHPAWGGLWINDHPMKGQSPSGLSGVRETDAVTAACVLMEAALFRDLGGFSEDYIIGDFEDSDLCLRAGAAGRKNMVALDVELFHLERQSQAGTGDTLWRANLTAYNCWLHNNRWSDVLERKGGKNGDAGRHAAAKLARAIARKTGSGRLGVTDGPA